MRKQKRDRSSRTYDPTNPTHVRFVYGADAFIQMEPTDSVDEYGPVKVLVRNGELVGTLGPCGMWFKLHCFKVETNKKTKKSEVWMKL